MSDPRTHEAYVKIENAVWDMIAMRSIEKGDPPWPIDAKEAVDIVVAATVGYLANAADQVGEVHGRAFRYIIAEITK